MLASLDISMLTPLSSDTAKNLLLQELWNSKNQQSCISGAYFDYYAQQCDLFSVEQDGHMINDKIAVADISTHRDLAHVAETIISTDGVWDQAVEHRRKARPSNANTPHSDALVNNSIIWAARLMSMVDVGRLQYSFSSHVPLIWDTGSLRDLLTKVFSPESPCDGRVRLEQNFKALSINRFAGIEIEWTNDLASHLSLREDDTKLLVFHHVTFLENVANGLLPPGLATETLQTISLLLPSSDRETTRWYQSQQTHRNLDRKASKCRKLRAVDRRIENFHYWRERLCILKQVFDEAEPSTLSQWWYDRRKGPQWYTFWVAVTVLALTIFFGIIQSIEGALQVYKAYYPARD